MSGIKIIKAEWTPMGSYHVVVEIEGMHFDFQYAGKATQKEIRQSALRACRDAMRDQEVCVNA